MRGLMQETPLTLQMVLERVGEQYPRKVVATKTADGVERQTYAELVERVTRLAAALADLGIRPGDRVATFAWNSARHLELYLAVPCMGAVLHTINLRLHPEQVSFIANHAEDQVVFVDASVAKAWSAVEARASRLGDDLKSVREVVVMDDGGGETVSGALDYEELLASAESAYAWPHLNEHDAAAMCYTSGTTGNPKGIVYSHRSNVLHSMAGLFADGFALSERDVALPIVPQFHANAWGLPYAALLTGASLTMPGRFMDPSSVAQLVASEQVTTSAAVPTVWFGVLQAIKSGQIDPATLASLKRINCGGAAVPEALQRGFDELGVEVVQAWGMTETNPVATVATVKSTVPDDEAYPGARTTAGYPLPSLRVRTVDDAGTVLPWDGTTPGELQITGPWIADAYYEPDQPDGRGGLDRFDDEVVGEGEGGAKRRWLRTGDVATIDAQGYVRIVDRTKDLVKSGGEWISSVDLENQLIAHDKVTEAAVIAIPDPKWDERPLACVVVGDESVTKDELLEHLAASFARWQLPEDVVFIDEVPKTGTGKFDKKVLRERFRDHRAG